MKDLAFILCLFISLFNPLLVWTRGYLFYTLGYNPILLYFLAQIVPALVKGVPASL